MNRWANRAVVGFVSLVLVLSAGLLVSCDKGGGQSPAKPAKAGKMVMGFSQIGSESDWRAAETVSIKDEAKKRGVDLRFADAQQKQENQIRALRSFITQGVNVIAFAPVVETGWEPVLREIKKAGIPVILTDRGVDVSDPSLYTAFIASDFVEEGRRAAKWMAANTTGDVKVFELRGTPGASCAADRKKGFEEGIAGTPRIKIIQSQDGNFERGRGKEVMEAFLKTKEGKDFNALYAHNDDMALGAIQAMKEAGLKPGKDIKIVSVDGVKAAFEAMVAGELNCTVECSPLLGPALMDVAEKLVKNPGVPVEKRIVIQEGVYDQTTAKDVIGSRKY
jgi:simple sugar transport system substrate-binding protein